jgi:hypothetical protein
MRRIFQIPKGNDLSGNEDYKSMVLHLEAYQKMGDNRNWSEYKNRIPDKLLEKWMMILTDCRRNGFIGPVMEYGRMVWQQVVTKGEPMTGNLCTMCDRPCKRREDFNSGEEKLRRLNMRESYVEPKVCWDTSR